MGFLSDAEDTLTGVVGGAIDQVNQGTQRGVDFITGAASGASSAASGAENAVTGAASGVMDQVNHATDRAASVFTNIENAVGGAVTNATDQAAHVVLAYLVLGAIVLVLGMALIWYLIRSGSLEHLIGIGAGVAAVGAGATAHVPPEAVAA